MQTLKKLLRIVLIVFFGIIAIINSFMTKVYFSVIVGNYDFIKKMNIQDSTKDNLIASWKPICGFIGLLIILTGITIVIQLIRKKRSSFLLISLYGVLDLLLIFLRKLEFSKGNIIPDIILIVIGIVFYLVYKEWKDDEKQE